MSRRSATARLLARLSGRTTLDRLAAVEEKIAKFGRAQREDLAAQRRLLDELNAVVSTLAGAADVRALARQVEDVQASLAERDRALSEALERARLLDEQGRDDRRFARRVEAMRRHQRPIVVGPWTGEVGFELLYWIPFVRWVVRSYRIPTERLFVISRGGVASWYGDLAGRYADVLSFVTPEEFRAATEVLKKQRVVGAFDAEVVKRITAACQVQGADLLHPGMMYRLLMPFWKDLATAARVDRYADYARIDTATAAVDPLPDLPSDYVAARFYFSECFPDTAANRAFVASAIETISREVPVVLLNTPFAVDDHRDVDAAGGRVLSLKSHMVPEQNLAVQTAAIARARAFIGTYGGYSYLAPFCGVPAVAFHSVSSFKAHHLQIAQRVFDRLGGAPLVALDVAAAPLVKLALSSTMAVPR